MFVGYLRNSFEEELDDILNNDKLFEIELLKNTYKTNPQYCFAAYKEDNIVAVISAYAFKKSIFINVISVLPKYEDILLRVVKLLIINCKSLNIFTLVNKNISSYFKELEFLKFSSFLRLSYGTQTVAFNFSTSIAKQVNSENYDEIAKKIDKEVFAEDREAYILKDATFCNSLKLSTQKGFLHSYVINKRYVRISPWLMSTQGQADAEKLLRAILYYRGLKNIFAYVPTDIKEIINLYKSYKFKQEAEYYLMYLGDKQDLKLEDLYAF